MGQQCSLTSKSSMSSVPIANLWAVLTNMVLYNLFGIFLVVRVAGWKKLLGMWPICFFLRKGEKRISRRSCTANILQKSMQEALGLLPATTSVLSYLNSTAIYAHKEKKPPTYLFIFLQILQNFIWNPPLSQNEQNYKCLLSPPLSLWHIHLAYL